VWLNLRNDDSLIVITRIRMPKSLAIITPKDLLKKTAQLAKKGPIKSAWSRGLHWLRFQLIRVNRVREGAPGEAV
jgi:hypothetical protein